MKQFPNNHSEEKEISPRETFNNHLSNLYQL